MKAIRVVVLDVDGTVVTCPIDFQGMRAAVRAVAARWGADTSALGPKGVIEQIREVAAALGERGDAFRQEAEQAVVDIEVEAAAGAGVLPGVPEALAELRREGRAVALITRNCRAAAERALAGMRHYDLLLTRDDVPLPKPDPDHVHRSLAALGETPDAAAVVGDHGYDMRAGRDAGVRLCLGVRTGGSSDEALREAGADAVIASAAELPAFLRAWCEAAA